MKNRTCAFKYLVLYMASNTLMSCIFNGKKVNEESSNSTEIVEYQTISHSESSGLIVDNRKEGVWKYYNTDGELVNVELYYHDSLVYILDTADFSYTTSKIEDKRIYFNYPENWEVIPSSDPNTIFQVKKKCAIGSSFCQNFEITLIPRSSSNMREYVETTIKILNSRLEELRAFPISPSEGFPNSLQLTFVGRYQGILMTGVYAFFERKDDIIMFKYSGPNDGNGSHVAERAIAEEIIKSFKYYD